jgi:hypothetical protein
MQLTVFRRKADLTTKSKLSYVDLIKHSKQVKNIWKLAKGMKADLKVFSILAMLEVRGQLHGPTAFNLWIKSPRSHCRLFNVHKANLCSTLW